MQRFLLHPVIQVYGRYNSRDKAMVAISNKFPTNRNAGIPPPTHPTNHRWHQQSTSLSSGKGDRERTTGGGKTLWLTRIAAYPQPHKARTSQERSCPAAEYSDSPNDLLVPPWDKPVSIQNQSCVGMVSSLNLLSRLLCLVSRPTWHRVEGRTPRLRHYLARFASLLPCFYSSRLRCWKFRLDLLLHCRRTKWFLPA